VIGLLEGQLHAARAPGSLLVKAAGVGYEVEVPVSTYVMVMGTVQPIGSNVTLFTHQVVREDAQVLYGFASTQEREDFRALLKVSGVGPRTAIGVLSALSGATLRELVAAGDADSLGRIPGVGRKTADRLIVQLKFRHAPTGEEKPTARAEASAALAVLGYNAKLVETLLKAVDTSGKHSAGQLIQLALEKAVRGLAASKLRSERRGPSTGVATPSRTAQPARKPVKVEVAAAKRTGKKSADADGDKAKPPAKAGMTPIKGVAIAADSAQTDPATPRRGAPGKARAKAPNPAEYAKPAGPSLSFAERFLKGGK